MKVVLFGADTLEVIDALRYKTQSLINRIRYTELHYPNSKKKIEEMNQQLAKTRTAYHQLKAHFHIELTDEEEPGEVI